MGPAYFLMFALQCLFPVFEMDAHGYLGLSVANTDTQAQVFTMTSTSSNGGGVKTGRINLGPNAEAALLLREILGSDPFSPGWIRVNSDAASCAMYLATGVEDALAGTDAE